MTALKTLQDRGQSIWLDSISRELLESGTLSRCIANLSVTGLTSNPTLFERAIAASDRYAAAIRGHLEPEFPAERLFFDFALKDTAIGQRKSANATLILAIFTIQNVQVAHS